MNLDIINSLIPQEGCLALFLKLIYPDKILIAPALDITNESVYSLLTNIDKLISFSPNRQGWITERFKWEKAQRPKNRVGVKV